MKAFTYRRKRKLVTAYKWDISDENPDVEIRLPRIVLSQDGNYYYIEHIDKLSMCWLSLKQLPGPVPKDKLNDVPNGWVQFAQKDGSEVYHRKVLPFKFYNVEIDSAKVLDLDPQGRLLYDFAYANNWEDADLTVKSGVLRGTSQTVRAGDYVVKDGLKMHCLTEVEFLEHYEKEGTDVQDATCRHRIDLEA